MHIALERLKELIWYAMKFFRRTRQDCYISFSAETATILVLSMKLQLTCVRPYPRAPLHAPSLFCQGQRAGGGGSMRPPTQRVYTGLWSSVHCAVLLILTSYHCVIKF